MLKVQPPFATGVTLNADVLLEGEIVAIPLHEFGDPPAGVEAVKLPLKPRSDAVNVCAFPLPVAVKFSVLGVRLIALGDAVAVGVGVGLGVAVGAGLAVGDGEPLGRTVGVGLGDGVVTGAGGTLALDPPEPLHAATTAAVPSTALAARTRSAHATRIR